jgi:4-hydroxy-tetrahydrodipicolinate synthase
VTITKKEKIDIIDTIHKANKSRVPMVLGIGGNNTEEVLEEIQTTDLSYIDAILSVSPYYSKPTQEGIYQHFKAIAKISPLPIILYNVPGRTASNISAKTTLRLAANSKKIIGIKEASGDLVQCMKIVKGLHRKDFLVISGEDPLTLPMLSFGMDGVISVVANAFPHDFSEMVRQGLNGNFTKASELHYKLLNIIQLLFKECNPSGVKTALYLRNICDEYVRLPLVESSDALTMEMKNAINDIS